MKKFWRFRAATDNPNIGELLLYGTIGSETWWGDEVTPKQFKADLDALGNVEEIRVFINSDGGDLFAGQAIYSMLKRHKAKKTVYIDGLAASVASAIAMAGDVVYMPRNAMMMIHNPWTIAMGTAEDFRKLADDMDRIRETLITVYQDKSGLERERIIEMMDAETWLTAEEAVELGFADEIEETRGLAASLEGGYLVINGQRFDLRRYRNAPKFNFVPKIMAGVVPKDVSREKAPEDEPWEAPALSDFTDKSWDELSDNEKRRIAGHFAWAAAMPPEKYGDLKLPHHRPKDGAVVWHGVANAAARLPQTDIPDEDVPKVQNHLGSHYRQFGRTPPWEEQEDSWREYVQVSKALRCGDLEPELVIRWLALHRQLFPEPRNEGRVLSAANEHRIRQARDLLNEVLDQLAKDKDGQSGQTGGQNRAHKAVTSHLVSGHQLLPLYQAQVIVNKNKIGGW
ncbi:head maturation protease, ClpP-related [Desulfovirgula thermocuniculi]|uniref:head maturation protease, ClpP-related n=1 Tax=Desulfovirgula thermocuniculi TaxID=348842 RepID=UPI00040466A7|nr:head maturation protease, ClpP-related [Desulfovirgula thermocuniculi]